MVGGGGGGSKCSVFVGPTDQDEGKMQVGFLLGDFIGGLYWWRVCDSYIALKYFEVHAINPPNNDM